MGFPHSSVGKESSCSAEDLSSIPGLGRSPGEGSGNPLQYSCLENLMDRGAWWATVHGVARVRHDLATKPPPTLLTQLNRRHRMSVLLASLHPFCFFFLRFMCLFLAVLGLCWCVGAFSSCRSRGYCSLLWVAFSLWWLLLLQRTGSRHARFRSCGSRALAC